MAKTGKIALAMILLPFLAIAFSAAQNTQQSAAAPLPILPGGLVVPLYPPGSPFLNSARVHEAEQFNMSQSVPGRINSIVNIHNPSIEVHTVERGINTGTAVILVPGGGHNTLNVGKRGRGFCPLLQQLRRQHHHPAQSPAP